MADNEKKKLRLEVAQVLFIDIVGYSKLSLNQQTTVLRELNGIVSGTKEFQEAESEGKLVRLPTGDGMALVFRTHAGAPAQCALEIGQALKSHQQIQLRMGVTVALSRSGGCEPAGEHRRCRHQHGATRDGLRGCWTHPALQTRRRRLARTIAGDRCPYLGACEVKHGARGGH
jgi:hypothetical protein